METYTRPRITASLITLVCSVLFVFESQAQVEPGAWRLVVAPRSTVLTSEGNIVFDTYLYNDSERKRTAPAPEALFDAIWTLRDPSGNRSERHGSNPSIGTDTVKKYVVNPREAIHSVLTAHFDSEPGDLLEFFINVDTKVNKAKTDLKPGESIRSNSVLLYRPME
jgi:hypothetical protein